MGKRTELKGGYPGQGGVTTQCDEFRIREEDDLAFGNNWWTVFVPHKKGGFSLNGGKGVWRRNPKEDNSALWGWEKKGAQKRIGEGTSSMRRKSNAEKLDANRRGRVGGEEEVTVSPR